jgi:hypothetical protein
MKKIHLISSVERNGSGIGSLFLDDLVRGSVEYSCYWQVESPFLAGKSLVKFGKFGLAVTMVLGRLRIWQKIRLALFRSFALRRRFQKVKKAIADSGADIILITTSSPELISIGRHLVEEGFNILVMVWDDPEYLISNLKLDFEQENVRIMHDFKILMQKTCAAAVISEGMRERYEREYNVRCEIVRHGISPRTNDRKLLDNMSVSIVYAGSLYSKNEWNAFVEALELSDWSLAGRPVELFFLGRFPRQGAARPARMKHIPPISQPEALQFLTAMDIGYLPYWIDTKHETVAKTSFPGKMTAYAAAGLDIFHHGPAYSTVTQFLSDFPFGLSCNSLEPEAILNELERLVNLVDSEKLNRARSQAMEQRLSDVAMGKSFQRLLSLIENKQAVEKTPFDSKQ